MMPHHQVTIVRWQVVAAFVIMVLVFSLGLWKVQHDSASIEQLQRTNCSLKQFLQTAERTRAQAAAHETGARRRQDLQAAHGYTILAATFRDGAVGSHCKPISR